MVYFAYGSNLPGRYIDEFIESVPSVEDPDGRRARENWRLLGRR